MMPLCAAEGVGVIPWSPLARGVLAGNLSRRGEKRTLRARSDTFPDGTYDQPSDFDVVDRVSAVAARRGVPGAQVALAWLLQQHTVVAPIIGATKISHIDDAVDATSLELDPDETASLEAPYLPHPIHGH